MKISHKQSVKIANKMTAEKIFIKVSSQVFQAVTKIFYNQKIYTSIHRRS